MLTSNVAVTCLAVVETVEGVAMMEFVAWADIEVCEFDI